MGEKNSFILYLDSWDELEMLTDEQRGQWIAAVFRYARDGEMPALDDLVLKVIFSQTRRCLDRDAEKYAETCAKNGANGKLGGRPKKPNAFAETERFSGKTKKADNDTVSENENDSDTVPDSENESEMQKLAAFSPPSLAEISAFVADNDLNVNPEKFYTYYQSQEWTVGQSRKPLLDWQGKLIAWNQTEFPSRTAKPQSNSAPSYDVEEVDAATIRKYQEYAAATGGNFYGDI